MRNYKRVMYVLGTTYLLVGGLFFFLPNELLQLFNRASAGIPVFKHIPSSSEFFWLVLATSMMMMLALLCYLGTRPPYHAGYTAIHLVSKLVSTIGFLLMFIFHERYFAYLVGAVVDGFLAVVVAFYLVSLTEYRKTKVTCHP